MKWTERRALAWAVLALCVALSVFGLGGMRLSRARSRALQVFTAGENSSDGVRRSVDAYLDAAAESAQIMAAEAERLAGETETSRTVADEAARLADDSAGASARAEALTALKTHVEKLYNETYTDDKSAFAAFKLAYDDFWGDDDLIRRDSYPVLARRYNQGIQGFPGALVAAVTGNGALETFGG